MRRAAFFDFDNTLILGDSQELEIQYFRSEGKISGAELARISTVYLLYKLRLVSKAALVTACIHAYKGMPPSKLKEGSPLFFEDILRPRLIPAIIRRLEEHLERNDLVAILTATPPHLVLPAATPPSTSPTSYPQRSRRDETGSSPERRRVGSAWGLKSGRRP